MFYISKDDTLAITRFSEGSWSSLAAQTNKTLPIAANSRHLSMTKVSIQSSLQVCLFYEDVNDTVSALRGSWKQLPEKAINFEPIRPSASTSSRPTNIPDSLYPINGNLVPNATNVTDWTWTWEDITGELRTSMSNNNFSAPFSSGVSPDGGMIAVFSKLKDDNTYDLNAFVTDYVNGTFKSGKFKENYHSLRAIILICHA